ncbi:MAG TPA: copper homeostasis protein CutC [Candidatus Acidoferrum sp.]|nr:copper homeostasis protein CutC [Candidatus Acidoferrum sp.]
MSEQILIEVCVDSVAAAIAAKRGGASRLELCSNLLESGVTPSAGVIELVRSKISAGLHVMIRPRGGDFFYSLEEFETMRRDIMVAKKLGADGVVLGILDAHGNVDVARSRELVELARPLNVTCHRAFDMSADLFRSLEDICATGADRVLTSGGEQTAWQGVGRISQLVKAARARIVIMAGGGIDDNNAVNIIEHIGVREIHVGLGSSSESPMLHRNLRISMGTALGREYQRFQVAEEDVTNLRRAVTLAGS